MDPGSQGRKLKGRNGQPGTMTRKASSLRSLEGMAILCVALVRGPSQLSHPRPSHTQGRRLVQGIRSISFGEELVLKDSQRGFGGECGFLRGGDIS